MKKLFICATLITLGQLASAQPQNNICDSVRLANDQTRPQNITSISFDWATKTLHIVSPDTPAAYEIKWGFAWEFQGQTGFASTVIWGGPICSSSFYNYYLSANQTDIDNAAKQYLIAHEVAVNGVRLTADDFKGRKRGYTFMMARARNALGYYSDWMSTGYLQP